MAKDAKGHGSNPRGYRGKYPDRIHTVSGMHERGLAHVRTNKGDRFHIRAKNTGGVMPKPGEGMDKYPHAEPVPANNAQAASQLASGPKSAPAPVHEAMSGGRYVPDHPDSNAHQHDYHPESVNTAISNSGKFGGGKIGGREARMIHSILKGRGK